MVDLIDRTELPKASDLPSTADLNREEALGWAAFWAGKGLKPSGQTIDEQRGWWLAHRRAYALGHFAAATDATDENPYPQFSGPWEAWGDGYNDGLEHGVDYGARS